MRKVPAYTSRLYEVMSRVLSIRIDSLIRQGRERKRKREWERSLSLCATHQRRAIWRQQEGSKFARQGECYHQKSNLLAPRSWLPASITVRNKFQLFKTFSLLYFVIVAQADKYRQCQAWFLWSLSYSELLLVLL